MHEELHLEEMDPHINAVKAQMKRIDHFMSPHFERANRVWVDVKNEFKKLWQLVKLQASRRLDRIGGFFKLLAYSVEKKKDGFVEDFSLTARTAFLLMRAYNTPKFARDIAEFCHKHPQAALRLLVEDLIGLLGCLWFVNRLLFPGRRKRLSNRKVQFAVTQ